MPRKPPSYRLHRPSGQAVVTLGGRDHYLGPHDSPESRAKYHRLMAEWSACPSAPPSAAGEPGQPPAGVTVVEVLRAFWDHARTHYRQPERESTGELENFRFALRPVRELYGRTPAVEFGPLALRAVRSRMVESGLARTTINARVNRIRRVFRWAASVEMVPVSVVTALATVAGLQRGRTPAREAEPVEPVGVDAVEKTLPHLNRTVAALVRFQLLTGCRPTEACIVRGRDLKPGSPNWTYEPAAHKTAYRGKRRIIPLGPRARALLAEFARPDPEAYLFDPRQAVAEHHRGRTRQTKMTPSARAKRVAKPGAKHCPRYDRTSYARSIAYACARAFPHPTLSEVPHADLTPEQAAELRSWRRAHLWTPNQLRHLVATEIRARFGLEAAQTVLGHARADVTQVYAERDLGKAHEVASAIG